MVLIFALVVTSSADFRAVTLSLHELALYAAGTLRILTALELARGAAGEVGGVAHSLQLLGQ